MACGPLTSYGITEFDGLFSEIISVTNAGDVPNQKLTKTKLRKNALIPVSTFTVVDKLSSNCDKTETVKLNFVLRDHDRVSSDREIWLDVGESEQALPAALVRRSRVASQLGDVWAIGRHSVHIRTISERMLPILETVPDPTDSLQKR